MTSIYDLSWSETSFLAKLQLFFKSRRQEKEKMRSSDRVVQAGGYSALSSTYYSIVGTAFSQLKAALRPKWLAPVKVVAWFPWLPLTLYCYWRMLPLSNRVVELIGYGDMSADQCDVRQSILRCRDQYDEARRCIQAALAKNPEKAHTRGLLYVGLAYICLRQWREAILRTTKPASTEADALGTAVNSALTEAVEASKQDPRQAMRIYRHLEKIASAMHPGNPYEKAFREEAEKLAQATGANDQLLKL